LHGNAAPLGGGIHTEDGWVGMENSIIAFGTQGAAFECGGSAEAELYCCDIYGNVGGDWVGCIAGQFGMEGNISEDPLFCDRLNEEFTLRSESPCAPGHNPACGLVGAWPVGCEPPGCVGDINNDGVVDLADLGLLLANWDCPVSVPPPCVGDLNNDGVTDLADLGLLLSDWGCTG
jgi:hypothetical protein